MSKHVKYVPKHAAPRRSARSTTRRTARTTVLLSGLAVSATAATVGTGVIVSPVSTVATLAAEGPDPAPVEIAPAAGRATRADDLVSRDASRPDDAKKKKAEKKKEVEEAPPAPTDPRDIARAMLPEFGFAADQFGCLDALWISESDWRVDADNPTSSAYGIPQGLTETHDMPPGYMTSAEVQIRWGLGYIQDAYGSPCNAWSFKQGNGWY